jgi:hypothetical protein
MARGSSWPGRPSVGLLNRRLAVIDIVAQPGSTEDRVHLVYNGGSERSGAHDLRLRAPLPLPLRHRGRVEAGPMGRGLPDRLNGWAFAVWEPARRCSLPRPVGHQPRSRRHAPGFRLCLGDQGLLASAWSAAARSHPLPTTSRPFVVPEPLSSSAARRRLRPGTCDGQRGRRPGKYGRALRRGGRGLGATEKTRGLLEDSSRDGW